MTFNDNAKVGGNTARRRGRGVAIGGGAAGLGVIAVLLLNLVTGGDFSGLLGGGAGGGGQDEGAVQNCQTGADANASDECRLAAASVNIDQYWATAVDGYRKPQLIIVDVETGTGCGTASNATGPFYCPPEETVYVDPTFFALLREQFDATAGPLAQMYVLAHEYGHHVQNITGIMQDHPDNGTGEDSNSVRTELQADCFAGRGSPTPASRRTRAGLRSCKPPTEAQVRDALDAASAVGDDHIQRESGAPVNPEAWTHGSSEQRQRWFMAGYQGGPSACDTFGVQGNEL